MIESLLLSLIVIMSYTLSDYNVICLILLVKLVFRPSLGVNNKIIQQNSDYFGTKMYIFDVILLSRLEKILNCIQWFAVVIVI